MYAVIETGGKQYKVAKNDIILVERLKVKPGGEVKLSKIVLAKEGSAVHVGSPYLKGSHVTCTVIAQTRQPKVIAYKYKRRKSEKKKKGHRQDVTKLKVKDIEIAKG